MFFTRFYTLILTLLLLGAPCSLVWGAPPTRYRVVDLPDARPGELGNVPLDPDSTTVIAARSDGTGLAVYRLYPDIQRLAPVVTVSGAEAILRIRGGRVASQTVANGVRQAFVWDNGQLTMLPRLDERDAETWVWDLNATSIIGTAYEGLHNPMHFLLWTHTASGYTVQEIPLDARFLNDRGDMAGRSIQYPPTCVVWLPPGPLLSCETPGAGSARALGINHARQVLGTYTLDGYARGFIWLPMTGALPLVPLHGYDSSTARGFNDDGDIVGSSFDQGSTTSVPTLWDNGHPRDLRQDIEDLHGRVVVSVESINNLGTILVIMSDANGNRRNSALLLPIDRKHVAKR